MSENPSAERFDRELESHRSPEEAKKYLRYFKTGEGQYGEGDVFVGVRTGRSSRSPRSTSTCRQ